MLGEICNIIPAALPKLVSLYIVRFCPCTLSVIFTRLRRALSGPDIVYVDGTTDGHKL